MDHQAMDPRIQNAIIQWRAKWQSTTMHMRRAALTNQGDHPRLTHAHQAGLDFMATTTRLEPILHQHDVQWARLFTNHLLNALQKALDAPDMSVTRRMEPITMLETGGRYKIQIDRRWLQTALDVSNPARIAKELGVSRKTVRREMLRLGLSEVGECPVRVVTLDDGTQENRYTRPNRDACPWTDNELDAHVRYGLMIFPLFGRSMMASLLRVTCGVIVPQSRLRGSLQRCAPHRCLGDRYRIKRRVYSVAGPNALWHMDAQLGLRRWGIVIHGMCDGASRTCTGIRANSNNRKETFYVLFEEAVEECGHPSRMRGDHGKENLDVAAHMVRVKGSGRGSFLWGPSVHNIRIERLWVDVTNGFGGKWKGILLEIEMHGGMNINDEAHLWLLHHLFLPLINRDAQLWRQTWNRHTISRLPDGKPASPLALFFFGSLHNGVRGISDDEEFNQAGHVGPGDHAYGIDWDDVDNNPRVLAHHRDNHPEHMSEVVLEDPDCPLLAHEIAWLDAVVARLPPAYEVWECLQRWRTGIDTMELIIQNRDA